MLTEPDRATIINAFEPYRSYSFSDLEQRTGLEAEKLNSFLQRLVDGGWLIRENGLQRCTYYLNNPSDCRKEMP